MAYRSVSLAAKVYTICLKNSFKGEHTVILKGQQRHEEETFVSTSGTKNRYI